MKKRFFKVRAFICVVSVALFSSLLFACCYGPAPNEDFFDDLLQTTDSEDENQENQDQENPDAEQNPETENNEE